MTSHSVSATQAKFIHSRIDTVEEHFGLMCDGFASVARKNAKCRDALDDFARTVVAFADKETLNRTMRAQVTHLADTLCGIADLQQTLVQSIEIKVVGGFAVYEESCKNAREDLDTNFKTQGREAKAGQQLELVKEKAPGDIRQLSQAESKLQRASFDVARTHAALEESIEFFEMKKLRDLRKILIGFCHSQLTFHARSLELFTRAYNTVEDIQVEADVEEFKKALMFPTGNLQYRTPDMISRSLTNFTLGGGKNSGRSASTGRMGAASSRQLGPGGPSANDLRSNRSQSLDRGYDGSRLRVPVGSQTYFSPSFMSYPVQSTSSFGYGYGVGLRGSRSRST
ncbi:protein FAM92A-like [Amphibalanus amphitrite]|uniref:protein FAM92A-like n=1 Tax=Amphibalanus amphitrite TaxID=1232801 RepID=UPI001C8FFEB1|nr:protein FAM92A-like [Amphibalanus amphitrite]